jgi:hypothetical protein
MLDYPPWNQQTVGQKLNFLHEWLTNVDRSMGNRRTGIQGLHERLRAVEPANAQPPKPQNPPAQQD